LMGRNVKEPKQVWELCKELQSLRHQMKEKIPLFIAIDMEGGRVARLKAPFTQWPPLKKLGDIDSPSLSFHFAQAMGEELKAVGINVDWAPCIDIFTNPKNTVIGDRSLGTTAEIVEKHASALIRGYMKAGVIPCAKHFPGHGHTIVDSHEDLPIEEHSLKRLHDVELIPFQRAIKSRVEMIMSAHILFKNIDKNWPATFSDLFLKSILREELRFRGLIITDDLDMKALSSKYDTRLIPVRALQAGADICLYCNIPESHIAAYEAIEKGLVDGLLNPDEIEASQQRILDVKSEYLKNPDPTDFATAEKIIGSEQHKTLAQNIIDGVIPEGLV
jgi:beta-N-acetylhexosaminidase